MNSWPLIFLLVLGLFGHGILWTALVNRIHGLGIARWIIDILTYSCAVALIAIPAVIFWGASTSGNWSIGGASTIYLAFCALLAIWSAVDRWWLRRADRSQSLLLENHTHLLDLRATHGNRLLATGVVRLLGSLPGNEILRVHVHEKQLTVPNLPVSLDGLRIVHLSDLHVSGRIAQEYYAAVVERVNKWQPDLIAITGDIVEYEQCIDATAETLGKLRATHGVYFVLGNHDRKTDHKRIRNALVAAGLVDVGGTSLQLSLRDQQVLLAGNELPWFPMREEIGDESAALKLLLAHGPDQFGWAQRRGFQLMLAGHNHGGQICIPMLGAIVAPSLSGTRFAGGAFQQSDTLLHVSRGTGSLSPIRWNCPPEIALLTLRSQEAGGRGQGPENSL